jgi:cell division protein FtsB
MMLLPKVGAHSRRHKSPQFSAEATASHRPSSTRLSLLLALPRRLLSGVRSVTRLRPSMLRPVSLPLLAAPWKWRSRRRGSSVAPGRNDGRHLGRRRAEQSPLERRRARALVLAAVVFAFIVVFFTMPWSVLASQHQQLSSDSSQVNQLQAENRALSAQARQLADPTAVAGLARQDYGLVRPGQRAYDILPPAGSGSTTVTDAGHVPLNQAPVVPGSRRSQELLGDGTGIVTAATAAKTSGSQTQGERSLSSGGAPQSSPPPSGGFWSRVAHTLEFWN